MYTVEICIDTSDAAMVGRTGWDVYDAEESVKKFLNQVGNKVSSVYFNYNAVIVVHETNHGFEVKITDDDDEDIDNDSLNKFGFDKDRIRAIVDEVRALGNWYVEAP
jgi:hypothetical protein